MRPKRHILGGTQVVFATNLYCILLYSVIPIVVEDLPHTMVERIVGYSRYTIRTSETLVRKLV